VFSTLRADSRVSSVEVAVSILIVEDTRVAAKLLEMLLARMGYETVTASSGTEALEVLRARADMEVVITDLRMPGMDGVELIRAIKAVEDWSDLPVIVVTNQADMPNVKQVWALGVKQYLLKPVDNAELERTVRVALQERVASLLSPHDVITKLNLDPAMYQTLAASFADLVEESLRLLEEPRESNVIPPQLDLQGLCEAAAMFGVERVQSLVLRLIDQDAAAADGIGADLERLAVLLRSLAPALRREVAAPAALPEPRSESEPLDPDPAQTPVAEPDPAAATAAGSE